MTRLLDARTSQNSSFARSLAIPLLPPSQEALFAVVGLNCLDPSGIVRAEFTASVSIQYEPGGLRDVTISVYRQLVRGNAALSGTVLVYTATLSEPTLVDASVRVFTVSGNDYDIPAEENSAVKYTVYVSGNATGMVRVGPESFSASLYCD
ncbi:hypothetical protein [Cohnella sp. AR92]|uniref:hypothetical protein n=1 Tax=Cohnella sp. AR92 TaxID=648716 RepID=UPI000F8F07B6|nr:hypothetical protein [Cohnella sp. AR92]RUS46445.1 hypothetical protein ELR57_15350 [Cohnella sp. AR92]